MAASDAGRGVDELRSVAGEDVDGEERRGRRESVWVVERRREVQRQW